MYGQAHHATRGDSGAEEPQFQTAEWSRGFAIGGFFLHGSGLSVDRGSEQQQQQDKT
jgi:hypothetical protein